MILREILVEGAVILHMYGHTWAVSDWVDISIWGWYMVHELTALSSFLLFCVVFYIQEFVFLYTGILEITLKIWKRRNSLNLYFYISW